MTFVQKNYKKKKKGEVYTNTIFKRGGAVEDYTWQVVQVENAWGKEHHETVDGIDHIRCREWHPKKIKRNDRGFSDPKKKSARKQARPSLQGRPPVIKKLRP
jgi:hypothetical protein